MTEETDLDPEGARLRRHSEKIGKVIGLHCAFNRGVKLITGEKRPDRALKWFGPFILSRSADAATAERAIAEVREKGFDTHQVVLLRDQFRVFKREEKSRKAKESRAAHRQRARVKSKNDKRLGARYKGKRIPPSKKI